MKLRGRKKSFKSLLSRALALMKEAFEPNIMAGRWYGFCRLCNGQNAHSKTCLIKQIEDSL